MARGMGAGFGHRNAAGQLVPGAALAPAVGTGDVAVDIAQIARDIHALVEHFVVANLLKETVFNLASGASISVDSQAKRVGSIIVSVRTGTLDVWWRDVTGVAAGTISHLEFTAVGAPVQIVLPPAERVFTLLANGALTQGCFTMSSV